MNGMLLGIGTPFSPPSGPPQRLFHEHPDKSKFLAAEDQIEYRYTRSNLAVEAGTVYFVEWSEDLATWRTQGVAQYIVADTGKIQDIKAVVPRSGRSRMFVRLKVVPNTGQTGSSGQGVTVSPILPPQITAQPESSEILSGSSSTLSVKVNSNAPRNYQWYRGNRGDTSNLVGTNASTFVTPALTADTSYWVRILNAAGSVDSAGVLVKMATAPSISTQPASVTITNGQTATLTVRAAGTAPFFYQWYQGAAGVTTTPVGGNSPTFTTPLLSATTSFWVRLGNLVGTVSSSVATITVNHWPSITTQPAPTTIYSGETTTLSVAATGTAPLTYQWYRGNSGDTSAPVGTNSAGFTTPALTATTPYWVRVGNAAGTVDSALVTVTVTVTAPVPADMALIPAGAFTMGRTSGDTNSDAPPVTITVSAFYMGKYEVTKALWDEVRTWGTATGYTDLRTGDGKAANHPVHTISWFDMVKWCNARSEKDGLTPVYTVSGVVMKTGTSVPTPNWSANGYRLPTEAEWEKAARGGVSGKRFPWGTDTISHSEANYYSSTSNSYDVSPTRNFHPTYATGSMPYSSPVGSFGANGYGLYDMAGNVWEWCWDWYGGSTYVSGATDPRGAASGTNRVLRGGSWNNGVAFYCRAANRLNDAPGYNNLDMGFRLARSSVP